MTLLRGESYGSVPAPVPGAQATLAPGSAAASTGVLNTGAATVEVATSETTTSGTYAALTTADSVGVTIGPRGLALVIWSVEASNSGANATRVSVAVSGASTVAAADTRAIMTLGTTAQSLSRVRLYTGLTPGTTTFALQYKVAAGTGTFLNRSLVVVPL